MLQVIAENQSEAPDAFRSWHVVAGLYGDRLGNEGLGTAAGNPVDREGLCILVHIVHTDSYCVYDAQISICTYTYKCLLI
jgi:hypothetical protein